MKRAVTIFTVFLLVFTLAGCSRMDGVKREYKVIVDTEKTIKYYEMTDGSWQCGGESYQYRLNLCGYLPNVGIGRKYVVLTNNDSLDFETVSKCGYWGQLGDFQKIDSDSVLVEIRIFED